MGHLKRNKKNQAQLLLAVFFLVGAAIRLYRLDYQSLWIDEVYTYLSSKGSLADVLFQSEINTNILPLYYIVVNTVLRIGSSDALLRLPSAVFGILSIPLLYVVAAKWTGKWQGICCAGLLAISPFHIWYSQEARPYSLLLLLGLGSIWFFQKFTEKPCNISYKAGFVATSTAAFYCHTVAIPFICAMVAYGVIALPRHRWKKLIPLFSLIAVLIMPGGYKLITASMNPAPDQPFNILAVPYLIWTFVVGYSFGPSLTELHLSNRYSYVTSHLHLILPILSFFTGLTAYGAVKLWKTDKTTCMILSILFLLPLFIGVLLSAITDNPFNIRYVILVFIPFIVFLSTGINSLPNLKIFLLVYWIVASLCLISSYNYFINHRYHKDNNRAASNFLISNAERGDLIICSASYTINNLKYYLNGEKKFKLVGYPMNSKFIDPSHIESKLIQIIGDQRQFWLFLSRTFHGDPSGLLSKYCEMNFKSDLMMRDSGVELIRYKKILR